MGKYKKAPSIQYQSDAKLRVAEALQNALDGKTMDETEAFGNAFKAEFEAFKESLTPEELKQFTDGNN